MNIKKYFYRIIIISLSIIFCVSCDQNFNFRDNNVLENIYAPENNIIPCQGTWKIIKIIDKENEIIGIESEYSLGDLLYIDNDLVQIYDDFTIEPKFKAIEIHMNEYMREKYNNQLNSLDFNNNLVQIIYITSNKEDNDFYKEIIKIDDNNIIVPHNGYIFFMENTSNIVDDNIKKLSIKAVKGEENQDDFIVNNKKLTLLIGLRSEINSKKEPEFKYKTILINWEGINSNPYFIELNNIIVPKDYDFWEIGSERYYISETLNDKLFAKSILSKDYKKNNYIENSTLKKIDFISSRFISVSNNFILSKNNEIKNGIYNIDKLFEYSSLGIVEIAGELGLEILNETNAKMKSEIINNSSHIELTEPKSNEIGIYHSQGLWRFFATANINENNENYHKIYNLNLMPKITMFSNNKLTVQWKDIKNFNSKAIDAITSPDGQIIVIQEKDENSEHNKLNIYNIQNNKIMNELLTTINIGKNDEIIMVEWAKDSIANYWKQEIEKIQ